MPSQNPKPLALPRDTPYPLNRSHGLKQPIVFPSVRADSDVEDTAFNVPVEGTPL